jgi:hypothetical protein
MPTTNDVAARGKVIAIDGQHVVFHPTGTTYQMHLGVAAGVSLPRDTPVEVVIRARARKVWTVPSGGLFVAPIFGPPRIIQGRVRYADQREVVLDAGVNVVVELPHSDEAYDLARGPIEVGALVNVTVLPGATIELVTEGARAR